MDLDVLTILKTKNMYGRYRKFVTDAVITEYAKTILDTYQIYFKEMKTDEVNWSNYASWFFLTVAHKLSKEDKEIYDVLISQLKTHTVSATASEAIIHKFMARECAARVADKALRVAEGASGSDIEDIPALIADYHKDIGKAVELDSKFVVDDIDKILHKTVGPKGLMWRLKCLNDSLGPLRVGDFVLIGKRPDSGGTTLLCSEATYMAAHMPEDKYIYWVNNEEKGESVALRMIQAALACDVSDIKHNPKNMYDKYKKLTQNKIKIFDDAKANVFDVQELLDRGDCGLLIVDQMWKLKGFEHVKSEVKQQEMIFNLGREWAKDHCPVLVVHQADGSAEGEKWISQNQLYGSKTAIQGELDAIITIGRSLESGLEKSRFIWVPKNKLCGGPLSDPALRNGRFEVRIKPEIARFET